MNLKFLFKYNWINEILKIYGLDSLNLLDSIKLEVCKFFNFHKHYKTVFLSVVIKILSFIYLMKLIKKSKYYQKLVVILIMLFLLILVPLSQIFSFQYLIIMI